MDTILEALGPLTVTDRALIAIALFVIAFAVATAVVSLVTGWRAALAILGALLVGAVLAVAFWPVDTDGLRSSPDPATGYDDALARFAEDRAALPELNPLCEPQILDHGRKVERVVVLIHGVSSCPRAFVDFAPLLHERGYNVVTALLPQNGLADRATDALSRTTAEELARFGDRTVDVAAGLGDEVTVLGISAGANVAAWVAQNREDVSRAVLVAPFFGLGSFGPRLNGVLMRAMLLLPDISMWKDPVARENATGGMAHAYLRQSTRATGEIMRLGLATYREAQERPPAAGDIGVIMNDADTAVSNATTRAVMRVWERDGATLFSYVFDAGHALGHELIDPEEPGADPALTYPVILQFIEDPASFDPASVPAP